MASKKKAKKTAAKKKTAKKTIRKTTAKAAARVPKKHSKKSPAKKGPAKKAAAKKSRTRAVRNSRAGGRSTSSSGSTRILAAESPDFQGLSQIEQADSESVDELVEEGNAFEAGAVAGVERADNEDEREVHTREVPEDDVPEEYLDEE